MKISNEQFKNFEKNLLVYFAGKEAPTPEPIEAPKIDYKEFQKLGGKVKGLTDKEKKSPAGEFARKLQDDKDKLLKKVNLDQFESTLNPQEKEHIASLKSHIDNQFKLLDLNYQQRAFELINRHGEDTEKVRKVEKALWEAADNFILRMEMHIIKENIKLGNKQAKEAAQARLIDNIVKVDELGKYILRGNQKIKTKVNALVNTKDITEKELASALREELDKENVFEKAISKMFDQSPNLIGRLSLNESNRSKVQAYFNEKIDESIPKTKEESIESSLLRSVGTEGKRDLLTTLTDRFYIEFNESGEPAFVVDLLSNENYTIENFEKELKTICQVELGTSKRVKECNTNLAKEKEKQQAKKDELLEGVWNRRDQEVRDIEEARESTILTDLIRKSDHYEKFQNREIDKINVQITKFQTELANIKLPKDSDKEVQTQLTAIQSKITPKKVQSSPALRKTGAIGTIIALVKSLSKKGDTKGLKEVSTAIDRDENPAEKMKEAEKLCEKMIKDKKPDVETVLSAVDNLFETKDKNDQTLLEQYPSKKDIAVKAYIANKLGFTEITKIVDNTITAKKNGREYKFKIFEGEYGSVIQFTKEDKGPEYSQIEYDGDFVSMKKALLKARKEKLKLDKEWKGKEKLAKKKGKYKNVLLKLAQDGAKLEYKGGAPSEIGKIVIEIIKADPALEKSTEYKATKGIYGKTKGDKKAKQLALDKARVEFITANYDKIKNLPERGALIASHKAVKKKLAETTTT